MRYTPAEKELFVQNRKNFRALMRNSSMAIFHANDEMPRSADGFFAFRQNPDLYYLSGIDQEKTILLMYPDSPNPAYQEVLFLRKTNEHIAIWEGHKYSIEEARNASGIKTIFWLEEFDNIFPMLMNWCSNVYLNANEHDRFSSEVSSKDLRFANALRSQYPLHHYERSAPFMSSLRSIKSDAEIRMMQNAMDITGKAFQRVLGFVKPGVMEYEIEAEITHEFIRNRAGGHAYTPIIASGKNACVLHYTDNSQECLSGDVVLMDFGAEYANYAADLTRSVPVNGRFTDRQKKVYQSVLNVLKAARKMLVAGNTFDVYNKEVGYVMEKELIGLGLLNNMDVEAQHPDRPLYKKYFMHGTSHFLGLDVHDLGNRYEKMQTGMVFTCEPGIYIPEENLGIRLENDILITEKGPIDMMGHIPIEVDEIEDLMHKKLVHA